MSTCGYVHGHQELVRLHVNVSTCQHILMPSCPHVYGHQELVRLHVNISTCQHVHMSLCPLAPKTVEAGHADQPTKIIHGTKVTKVTKCTIVTKVISTQNIPSLYTQNNRRWGCPLAWSEVKPLVKKSNCYVDDAYGHCRILAITANIVMANVYFSMAVSGIQLKGIKNRTVII